MSLICTVVMPAYNEEGCIALAIAGWTQTLGNLFGNQFRIIIINDGSTDRTATILDEFTKNNSALLVSHQRNRGHGASIVNGYEQALALGSDYVFQTDSDNQFEASDFIQLWQRRSESKFILGCRKKRDDAWPRIVISKTTSGLIALLFAVRVKDSNIPYRLMEANFLRELLPSIPADAFAPNIFLAIAAARRGQKLLHIPIPHKKRKTGKASMVKWTLVKACITSLIDIVRFRIMVATRPGPNTP